MENTVVNIKVADQVKLDKYLAEEAKRKGIPQSEVFVDIDALVLEVDDYLIEQGFQPFQRPFNACLEISRRLGLAFVIGAEKDEFVKAVHKVYEKLYRKSDLYVPPLHIGTFAFKDIFLPLRILVVYGRAAVNPMQGMKDVPENVLKWIFHREDTAYALIDQWVDLMDFVYGLDDLSRKKGVNDQAVEFWQLAKQQLEGAAATLLGSIDKYTVIQNSVIAIELILKGALLAQGIPEAEVKEYGHKMQRLVDKVCEILPKADHVRLKMIVNRTPKLVERRYQMKDYKRTELGQIMMDAQYVAGEILRQFTDRDVRASVTADNDNGRNYNERHYPPVI